MKISILPARSLAPELVAAWRSIQAADPALSSPFLCPEFTAAVAESRADTEVAVFEDDGVPVGFFPYQRCGRSRGRPVGEWMNDFQAVVATPGLDWNCAQLMRACRLDHWEFERLLDTQVQFVPSHARRSRTAFMDVSQGYERYVANRRRAGTRIFPRVEQLARKAVHEVGPLRFEAQSADQGALAQLMQWKFERYAVHGYGDIFSVAWARELVERVHARRENKFAGMLSLLYVDDELAAGVVGIRSHTHWHSWHPAYNPRFARYSPGLVLLLQMARHAPEVGVERIELGGPEDYDYKQRLMSCSTGVAEGTVDRLAIVGAARRLCHFGERWVRASPAIAPVVRGVVRALRKAKQVSA